MYRITLAYACGGEQMDYIVIYVDEETEEICGVFNPSLNTTQDGYLFDYDCYRVYLVGKFKPTQANKRLNTYIAKLKLSGVVPDRIFM